MIHQNVVQEAMELRDLPYPLQVDPLKNKGLKAVIPMKFGTIFKTKENLEATLKKYYSKFKQSLENLKGKQEWSVKAYLNRKAFEKEVKKVSPVVQEKEKEAEVAVKDKKTETASKKELIAITGKEHTLDISAIDTTWLLVQIDDTEAKDMLLNQGESLKLSAKQGFSLKIVNAG